MLSGMRQPRGPNVRGVLPLIAVAFLGALVPAAGAQDEWRLPVEDVRPASLKVDQLTYDPPKCRKPWTREHFLQYIHHEPWWPRATDTPYPHRGTYYGKHQDEFLASLPEHEFRNGKDQGPTLSARWWSVDQDQPKELPIQWIDIDGDGTCDAIVESYVDMGDDQQGRQANTWLYMFLQTKKGFRLIDFTPRTDSPWGSGYTPEALLPVWVVGETRPFLVARQTSLWVAARELAVLPANPLIQTKVIRSAIRWDPTREDWDLYQSGQASLRGVRTAGDVISEFLERHPPRSAGPYCDAAHWGNNNSNPGCTEPH